VVCFRPLDAAAAAAVTRLLATETAARLLERQIRLDVAPDLVQHIAAAARDQVWPPQPNLCICEEFGVLGFARTCHSMTHPVHALLYTLGMPLHRDVMLHRPLTP
jgi:hypothetical protein